MVTGKGFLLVIFVPFSPIVCLGQKKGIDQSGGRFVIFGLLIQLEGLVILGSRGFQNLE